MRSSTHLAGLEPEAAAARVGPVNRSRLWPWLRVALSGAILVAVIVWVVSEGEYLRKLSLRAVAVSTALSLLTALLHGKTLQVIASAYGRSLAYADALRISSLGSIGNAAGGLPLGTALKVSVLRDRVGLQLTQIAAGMAIFTLGISLSLLLFAVLSIAAGDFPGAIKVLALGTWGGAVAATAVGLVYLGRQHRLSALVAPLIKADRLARCAMLSFLVAGSFVLNSCATGALLLPEASLNDLLFISSAGTLLGLLSFLQGVAGIQELAMALAALTVGMSAPEGAQVALTLRATAIAASALVLLGLLALRRWRQRGPD